MNMLDVSNELQVAVVELVAINLTSNQEETFYYSTTGYVTKPTDTPANTAYHSRAINGIDSSMTLEFGGGNGGISSIGYGSIELSNIDGELDKFSSEYALVGRSIEVKAGDRDGGHSSLRSVFSGTIIKMDLTSTSVRLQVQDNTSTLDTPLSKGKYGEAGTAGEPTFNKSLHGKYLPICYGEVFNVTPSYVGVVKQGDVYDATFDKYTTAPVLQLTNSDRTLTRATGNTGSIGSSFATVGVIDKSYIEIVSTTSVGTGALVGVVPSDRTVRYSQIGKNNDIGWGYDALTGDLFRNGVGSSFGPAYSNGTHVVGIAIDAPLGHVWFSLDGVWLNGGDPATGVNPSVTGISSPVFPGASQLWATDAHTTQFKPSQLSHPVPAGFNTGASVPVTTSELMYQVHDGPITDITAVYSNGNPLDPSQYVKFLSEGKFQILLASVSGATITADVQGDSTISPYNSGTEIIKDILTNRVAPAVPIDLTQFADLSNPYHLSGSIISNASSGVYYQHGVTASQALAQFNTSFGMFSGFNREGTYDVGIFIPPVDGDSVATLQEEEIINIKLVTPREPKTAYTLGYRKNYTVLTESSIAPVILENSPDHYADLIAKYRVAEATINTMGIHTVTSTAEPIPLGSESQYFNLSHRYPLATDSDTQETVIQDLDSATNEANRRWLLYNSNELLRQRTLLSVTAKLNPTYVHVNDVIQVIYPRYGLDTGMFFRIVGYKEDAGSGLITLELWGPSEPIPNNPSS